MLTIEFWLYMWTNLINLFEILWVIDQEELSIRYEAIKNETNMDILYLLYKKNLLQKINCF